MSAQIPDLKWPPPGRATSINAIRVYIYKEWQEAPGSCCQWVKNKNHSLAERSRSQRTTQSLTTPPRWFRPDSYRERSTTWSSVKNKNHSLPERSRSQRTSQSPTTPRKSLTTLRRWFRPDSYRDRSTTWSQL